MRGRRRVVAAAVAALCVIAGLINSGVSAGADDDATIDVDAGAVTSGADGKCSLAEAITNVSGLNQVWADCPSGAGITTIHVAAGTYTLTAALPLIRQSVEIQGDGADITILDGQGLYQIFNAQGGAWFTVSGLTLRNGKAGQGGALAAFNANGTMNLTVRDSSFEHNTTTSGEGGAIYLSGASLTVTGSSFIGNVPKRDGGAIGLATDVNDVSVTIANSTFVDNTAKSGGVFAVHEAGHNDAVTVVNSTFSGNDATTKNTGLASNITTVTLKNSIVAKGAAKQPVCETGNDAFGAGTGHNLTDDVSCSAVFFTVVSAVDLGTIGLHGGTTANFEPPAESPAIDAGDDATCVAPPVSAKDQRGFTRTGQGPHCDLGAVEVQVSVEPPLGAMVGTSKSVSGDFAPGGEVTYSVILTNSGAGAQGDNPGHEFVDSLPAGLVLESAESSSGKTAADSVAGTVAWDGTIAADGTVTITIRATVTGAIGETISNQATTSYDSDGDEANDASAASDDPATSEAGDATSFAVTAPDIDVTKTITTPAPYRPGDSIGYQIVVSNDGNATAGGVELHDVLDANIQLDTASVTTTAGEIEDSTNTGQLDMGVGDIAAGASVVVTFDVTVVAPAPLGLTAITNQAVASGTNFADVRSDDDNDATNGLGPTLATVTTTPDLDLTIAGGATATPGSVVVYELDYSNSGDVALADVNLTAEVPTASTFESAESSSGWDCAVDGTAGDTCTLGLGDLTGGALGVVWFAVALDGDIAADTVSFDATAASGATSATGHGTTAIVRPSIAASISGPSTANPAASVSYPVAITNSGAAAANAVVVTSTLPDGLTFSPGGDCTADGQLVTCAVGDIDAGGGTATVTIDATVASSLADQSTLSVGGSLTWTLSASPVQASPASTTIEAVDLTAFVDGTPEAAPGETVVLSVIYANQGSATATGVWIAASLPAGSSLVSELSPGGWECTGSDCVLPFGTLAPGSGATPLAILVGDVDNGVQSIGVALSIGDDGGHGPDADTTDNTTSALISIVRPDLAAVISGPSTANPAGSVSYPVAITNSGSAAANDVVVTSTLPDGLTFSPGGDCTADGQLVTCAVGDIDAGGGTATVTIDATVASSIADESTLSVGGSLTWTLSASPVQASPASTTIEAVDLTAFVDGTTEAAPGETVVLSVIYANQGSATATGVWIAASLPAGSSLVSELSPGGWECTGSNCVLPFGTLAPGSGATPLAILVGDVDNGVQSIGVALSIGDDGGHGPDADTTDNASSALISIVRPDLAVALTAPGATTPGGVFVYTATVTNVGAATAAVSELSDALPEAVSFDAGTSSAGCSATDGLVSCSVPSLGVGDSAAVTIGVVVSSAALDGAPVANHVVIDSVSGESVTSNNTSADAQTITGAADLRVAASGSGSVRPGSGVAYQFDVSNAGSLPPGGVLFTVTLADGLLFDASGSSVECAGAGQVVTCAGVDIEPGGSRPFVIAAAVAEGLPDGAALASKASATSATAESTATLSDNDADVVTAVAYLVAVDAVIAAPASATTAESITYLLTLTNAGDSAATEFVITMGEGASVDSVTPSTGFACEPDAATTFACSGTMPAGAAGGVTVVAHLDGSVLDAAVSMQVTGRAFTGDSASPLRQQSFSVDATTSATRTVVFALAARVSPQAALPGGDVTYTITATNEGDPVGGANLTIALPDGVEFVGATSAGGLGCVGGQTIVCSTTGAGWASGASATVTVAATVSDAAPPGSPLVAFATLRYGDTETSATATGVVALPPPEFVIAVDPPSAVPGETSYTYNLVFRWTLITWVGADGVSPGEALAAEGAEADGPVEAVYTFDAAGGEWLGYFGPGVPADAANDLMTLRFGQVYWIAITGTGHTTWTVPMGRAGE